eukprot:scaffold609299_cov43-Prasinocladus_malaysianus.AAC.1
MGPSPLLTALHHESGGSSDNLRALGLTDEDVFGACGGLEIGADGLPTDAATREILMGLPPSAIASLFGIGNGQSPSVALKPGAVVNPAAAQAAEHPFGEHPSRTLFVRNINWSVEEAELRALFESYGE